MLLYIKHKKPLLEWLTGKWKYKEQPYIFYVIEEDKRVYVQPKEDTRAFILNLTIDSGSTIGRYNPREDCIMYTLDMEKYKLKLNKIPTFDNLIFVEFEEVKEESK